LKLLHDHQKLQSQPLRLPVLLHSEQPMQPWHLPWPIRARMHARSPAKHPSPARFSPANPPFSLLSSGTCGTPSRHALQLDIIGTPTRVGTTSPAGANQLVFSPLISISSYDIVHPNYMKTDLGIWEITVLSLLRESPMHPYQMQRLLRDRHKDEILVLKRGSLYHAIGRLVRAELIRAKDVTRNGRRPERTTYAITAPGRKEFISALRRIIATPHRECSE